MIQKLLTCYAEIQTKHGCLMKALCVPSLGAPGHVTKIFQAENRQKGEEFESIYLGKNRY